MGSNHGRIRFQLLINGEPKVVSGIESHCVMSTSITWAGNAKKEITDEIRADPEFDEQDWLADEVYVRLGGLDSETEEHLTWLHEYLQPGDEVTIRVLPTGERDPPIKKYVRQDS